MKALQLFKYKSIIDTKIYQIVILIFVISSLFIVLGNFGRLDFLAVKSKNLPFGEILFLTFGSILTLLNYTKKFKRYYFLSGLYLIINIIWGLFHFNFSIISIIYPFRLFLLIVVSINYGLIVSKFNISYQKFLTFFCLPYAINSLLGIFLLKLFPNSWDFWLLLKKLGLTFNGDPHTHRFISMFFDPNYYVSITFLPLLLALQINNRRIKFTFLFLFIFGMYNALSRAGIILLIILFIYLCFLFFKLKEINSLKYFCGFLLFIQVFSLNSNRFYWQRFIDSKLEIKADVDVVSNHKWNKSEELFFMRAFKEKKKHLYKLHKNYPEWMNRINNSRLRNIVFAYHHWTMFPLSQKIMGISYNQLKNSTNKLSLPPRTSYDSSFINIIFFFGFIGIILFVNFTFRIFKKVNKIKNERLRYDLIFYSFITLCFLANLNNILFLNFWIVTNFFFFAYILSDRQFKRINSPRSLD